MRRRRDYPLCHLSPWVAPGENSPTAPDVGRRRGMCLRMPGLRRASIVGSRRRYIGLDARRQAGGTSGSLGAGQAGTRVKRARCEDRLTEVRHPTSSTRAGALARCGLSLRTSSENDWHPSALRPVACCRSGRHRWPNSGCGHIPHLAAN